MIDFIKTISGLMPPDVENRESMRAYHRHNSIALSCCVLALIGLVLPAMFYAIPRAGSLAWAGDVDGKIDAAVTAKLKPVNDKLLELNKQQQDQGDILAELATASLRGDICRYVIRRTKETDPSERARLLNQIEDMRRKFSHYAKRDFNTADC